MMMIRIVLVVGMKAAEDNGSRRKSKSGCRLASEEAEDFIIIIININNNNNINIITVIIIIII